MSGSTSERDGEPGTVEDSWAGMFRGARGIYTILLNLGIGIHAIDIFVISTVMPLVVTDIGGVSFYAWTAMLYMVGTIVGAASGQYTRSFLGRRKGYVAGGLIFLVGAAGCAASPTMGALLLFRVVEGFGGGLLMSQSMTLVNDFYPGPLRTRILAAVTTTWSIASVAGPLIGGVWGNVGFWRGAFLTTCLLTVIFIVAAWRVVPESERMRRGRLPWRRLLLLALSVVFVGTTAQVDGTALRIALSAAGVASIWLAIRLDSRGETALFPRRVLSLFAPIGTAYWVFLLLSASYTPLTIFMPLALREIYGLDPLWIGYIATIFSLGWTVGSIATAGWRDAAAKAACAGGLLITCLAMLALAVLLDTASIYTVTALITIAGVGVGASNVHSISWALAAAGREESQITASAMPAMRSVGIAFGSAIAQLIANSAGLDRGTSPEIVADALAWVFGLGAIAPLAGSLCILRMYALKPGVKV